MKDNIQLNARYYKAGLPKGINILSSTCTSFYDAFTLTETETFTETNKMDIIPNEQNMCRSQYGMNSFQAIFLSVSVSVNTSLT